MKKLHLQSTNYNYLEKAFAAWLDILGYAKGTVNNLPNAVREFLYFLEQSNCKQITELTNKHIKEYYKYLTTRISQKQGGALSSKYINLQFYAIDKFFEFLHHKGTRNLPEVNLKRLKIEVLEREVLSQEEIKTLYQIIENQEVHSSLDKGEQAKQTQKQEALNYQDKVMLTIYYGCGLRRTEGINVSVDDINFDTRILHIKKGKGGKQRLIPFNKTASKYLQDWVFEYRTILVKDKKENSLFINRYGKPLTGNTLNSRLQNIIDQSENIKLKEKNITLHSLRHSIATHLLANGMEIQKVQKFLGHSSLETTEIYTHLLEEKQ
jgi:integrase/recombinase XerD